MSCRVDAAESGEPGETPFRKALNELTDKKHNRVDRRERALISYIAYLTSQFVEDEVDVSEVLPVLGKSIKADTENEVKLGLKALSMTSITTQDSQIYDGMRMSVESVIKHSDSPSVKAAGIHCLGAIAFWSGGIDEILAQMGFFMEIVTSDGDSVDAFDNALVVTAAMEEWGFLATEIEDMEEFSEDAVDAFADQLESSAASVQIAAGENIALLYEKSYNQEDPEEMDSTEYRRLRHLSPEDMPGEERYSAYHNKGRIIQLMEGIAHVSGRGIKKSDKRSLHSSFASILATVENPTCGPSYNQTIDPLTNQVRGSYKTVKIDDDYAVRTDMWWKFLRLAAYKRLLGGGFRHHFADGNPAVVDYLPVEEAVKGRTEKRGKRNGFSRGFEGDESDYDI